jgi:hypothetical protein
VKVQAESSIAPRNTGSYTLNVAIANAADDIDGLVIPASTLLENDSDIDGDMLEIISVGNAINGSVALTASGDVSFTSLSKHPGSFEYTVSDGQVDNSTATATVTVNGSAVVGDAGDNTLTSTSSNELFTGGDGSDTFVFGPGSGDNTVADFIVGVDFLMLTGGITPTFVAQGSDTLVNFDSGDSVLLVGVTGVPDIIDPLA